MDLTGGWQSDDKIARMFITQRSLKSMNIFKFFIETSVHRPCIISDRSTAALFVHPNFSSNFFFVTNYPPRKRTDWLKIPVHTCVYVYVGLFRISFLSGFIYGPNVSNPTYDVSISRALLSSFRWVSLFRRLITLQNVLVLINDRSAIPLRRFIFVAILMWIWESS